MSRSVPVLIVLLLFTASACSTSAPTQTRDDAVMSGDETAKAAADAARKAAKDGNTGILVASSQKAPPEETEADDEKPPPPSVLRIEFQNGSPTMNGEPIPPDAFSGVVREAVEANPDVLVVIARDNDTGPEVVAKYLDIARDAGARHFSEQDPL